MTLCSTLKWLKIQNYAFPNITYIIFVIRDLEYVESHSFYVNGRLKSELISL